MNAYEKLKKHLPDIARKIGYEYSQHEHLMTAFVHRSFINENRELQLEHNERLEFLGDSVLGLSAAEILYHLFPDYPEGVLSQLRSRLVDASACALYMEKLDVKEFILLGIGEEKSLGRSKCSILANVFEAILASIFLDGGYEESKNYIEKRFSEEMREMIESPSGNFKAQLQDYSQKKFQKPPVYKVMKEEGPDHAKMFHIAVLVDEKEIGEGTGNSKKDAEQKAAKAALLNIERQSDDEREDDLGVR